MLNTVIEFNLTSTDNDRNQVLRKVFPFKIGIKDELIFRKPERLYKIDLEKFPRKTIKRRIHSDSGDISIKMKVYLALSDEKYDDFYESLTSVNFIEKVIDDENNGN